MAITLYCDMIVKSSIMVLDSSVALMNHVNPINLLNIININSQITWFVPLLILANIPLGHQFGQIALIPCMWQEKFLTKSGISLDLKNDWILSLQYNPG